MQSLKRVLFVGGNWKSNGTIKSTTELCKKVLSPLQYDNTKLNVCVAPIYLHIQLAKSLLKSKFIISSQNVSAYKQGAYTAEITADQLKDIGVKWAIIGHSERRSIFGESDSTIATKQKLLQEHEMNSILCIGEKLQEREANQTWDVCKRQLEAVKNDIKDWKKVVIAYEPVWAIGTGKTASPDQAQEVHALIRKWLQSAISPKVSQETRIIYGGSVTEKNSSDLIKQPDIDGFLVGGASLKPGFKDIIDACNKIQK